jgi:hypothetical protein
MSHWLPPCASAGRWPLTGPFCTSRILLQPGVETSAMLNRRQFLGIAAASAPMLGQAPNALAQTS